MVIAGLKGGSGKTTLSLGLLNLWKNNGHKIIPFKKGPDYIDAGWLSAASGNSCYNLDTFIIPEKKLIDSFLAHAMNADAALIEGNRGLFDGLDAKGTFSTASLSKMLRSPVIVVVDCKKTTSTIGVIVKGVNDFDRALKIKGVVLNHIANERHESVVKAAVEYYSGMPVVGAIRRQKKPVVIERHMGLVSHQEYSEVEKNLITISNIIKDSVNVDEIWQAALAAPDLEFPELTQAKTRSESRSGSTRRSIRLDSEVASTSRRVDPTCSYEQEKIRIGVLKDSAFQFYYPENFEELRCSGAEIVEINAMDQIVLPEIDALYIGGGFPETNAPNLSKNVDFRKNLKTAIESGLPVYAECGGLMFLGRTITYKNRKFPMVNIFPMDFVLDKKPQAHGYTVIEIIDENPYLPKGTILRGHEFHYSRVKKVDKEKLRFVFKMERGKGISNSLDGITYKNVLATYTHLHALGASEWVSGFMNAARRFRK